jgi:phosphoribosyl-ATP pyrophosphohydrolase
MGERTENVQDANLGEVLKQLADVVRSRRAVDPEQSYTARMLTEHEDKLYKKIVEEATELVLASKDRDHDHIRYEAADLLYHLLALLERTGVTTEELAGELKARMVWHAPQYSQRPPKKQGEDA